MRVSAYKKLLDSAKELPPALADTYLNFHYSPRNAAIGRILKEARHDDNLYDSEFVKLVEYAR